VTYVLDVSKPRLVVSAPKNGAVVNARTIQLVGQTQARSTMSATNLTTNATVAGAADEKGAFSLFVPIASGINKIEVSAVDPAGNENKYSLSVRRGTGALKAKLSASVYLLRIKNLPEPVTLSVVVTDPDGRPLKNANVTFTLAVPGEPAITSNTLVTSTSGRATFTTTIPKGAMRGTCSVTVIVQTADFGGTTDRSVINITR
jgi:uncharacterized GH25 family protein